MNAPIQSPLTEAAISNPAILRYLESGPVHATASEIARSVGIAPKNINRTLGRLQEDGIITTGGGVYDLTPAGRRALQAINLADGRLEVAPAGGAGADESGVMLLTHDQMRPNPLQPRKAFAKPRDEWSPKALQELEELAATIHDADDVLQNLVVFPANADGVHDIAAGERRWRAVGLLIERGLWPTDRRLRAIERERTQGQVSYLALVENGQRANLTLLEEARAYQELMAETGLSARAAALKTGRDPRTVQEMQRVLTKASAEDIALHEAGERTWEWLRETVKETTAPEPGQIDIEDIPPAADPDFVQRVANAKRAIEAFNAAMEKGDEAEARIQATAYRAIVIAENGGESFGMGAPKKDGRPSAEDRIGDACAAPDGEVPMWGQRGRFVLDINGMLTVITSKGRLSEHIPGADVDVEALDPNAAFFSNTGYRSIMSLKGPGALSKVVTKQIVWFLAQKEHFPGPIDEMFKARLLERPWPEMPVLQVPVSWLQVDDPRIFDGKLYPNETHANQARLKAQGGAPSNSGAKRAKPDRPALEVTPVHKLVLLELAAKLTRSAMRPTGPNQTHWTTVRKYWLDQAASDLVHAGLIQFSHAYPNGPHATLTEGGDQWLDERSVDVEDQDQLRDAIVAARADAGQPARDDAEDGDWLKPYVTPWLNVDELAAAEAEAPPPAIQGGEDEADDDEDPDEEPGANDLLPIVARAIDHGDDFDRAELFDRAGVAFPLLAGTGDELGVIFDANGMALLCVDSDGSLPADDVKARVLLVLTTLNAVIAEAGPRPTEAPGERKAEQAAVPIRRSITPDHITCLEDGRKLLSLTHHIRVMYGLTPDAYRERWGLPRDYPMVAPRYAQDRYQAVRDLGLL